VNDNTGVIMAEYEDILRLLASNPPHLEPEKKIHASLLEMLAKKLRGEDIKVSVEGLKYGKALQNIKRKFH
jgi:hypothetical protein